MSTNNFHNQNAGQIMCSGSDSKSLEELKEGLLEYVSVDYPSEDDGSEDWQDWQRIQKLSVEELCEIWGFSIKKTHKKLNLI